MKEPVRLRTRPSRDGKTFTYILDYVGENGKRHRVSLGHADHRKAESQKTQKERELRMGVSVFESMNLNQLLEDAMERIGNQIRESTKTEQRIAMEHFIKVVGNIDIQEVTFKHGELFCQACLDADNAPATVAKKLQSLKRLFNLAIQRKQLDENPIKYVKPPKSPRRKIEIYTDEEAKRIIKAATEYQKEESFQWGLLILVALTTGMRRGELLNAVWGDVDFEKQTIDISPKKNTAETWEWLIKDLERRTLPLTEDIVTLLAEHQSKQPENHPYIFVPPARYKRIMELKDNGNWTLSDSRLKVINNFNRAFNKILERANVRKRKFHAFRNTAITNWFASGVKEYEVMRLAGHSDFSTTHRFYLAVSTDLVDKARQITSKNLARIWRAPSFTAQND